MHKLQPLTILSEGNDTILVRFSTLQGDIENYTFTTEWDEDGSGVLNCDQNEFFIRTFDDPGRYSIEKSVSRFGDANSALAAASPAQTLTSIFVVDSPKPNSALTNETFIVKVQTNSGEVDYKVTSNSLTELAKITSDERAQTALKETIQAFQAARRSHLPALES